jgi:hypothetical protein
MQPLWVNSPFSSEEIFEIKEANWQADNVTAGQSRWRQYRWSPDSRDQGHIVISDQARPTNEGRRIWEGRRADLYWTIGGGDEGISGRLKTWSLVSLLKIRR